MYTENITQTMYNILIVDDIAKNLQVLGNILSEHNLDISFATSGGQAIKLATVNKPDLILLDISMPEMDGYEVCAHLKQQTETSDIPIIFLTARTETDSIVKGFQVGGHDYVTKPFNAAELIARVFTHLELKNKREELSRKTEALALLNNRLHKKKNEMSAKNKYLTDSINYAKIIQGSLLPTIERLANSFNQAFVLFHPKDIVSGDFYYFDEVVTYDRHQSTRQKIVVVADCTGHGVPGALLTMLGLSLLKQTITYEQVYDPAQILFRLNMELTDMLTNHQSTERSSDGMDIAVCTFDSDNRRMTFCGCKRPVYIARNGELIQIDGGIHPVGGFYDQERKEFVNHEIELQPNDRVFLFSDGFADQFGGSKNKKFNRRRFRDLILESSKQAVLTKQKELIQQEWNEWKADYEQVDDVLILGIEC